MLSKKVRSSDSNWAVGRQPRKSSSLKKEFLLKIKRVSFQ